jgi:hypothetical protein
MSGWDVLNNVVSEFPPVAMALLLVIALVAAIVFVAGFSKHGLDFVKYGFGQNGMSDLGAKIDGFQTEVGSKISGLQTEFGSKISGLQSEFGSKISGLQGEIENMRTNHFGHLKNYLGILNGVLLDKDIIDNETKARLDNELRGM